jgi:hypothetical protein
MFVAEVNMEQKTRIEHLKASFNSLREDDKDMVLRISEAMRQNTKRYFTPPAAVIKERALVGAYKKAGLSRS